jgi:ribosome-binding ATPase
LQLKDLDNVERKWQKTEKLGKTDPKAKIEAEILHKCKLHLEQGKNIVTLN